MPRVVTAKLTREEADQQAEERAAAEAEKRETSEEAVLRLQSWDAEEADQAGRSRGAAVERVRLVASLSGAVLALCELDAGGPALGARRALRLGLARAISATTEALVLGHGVEEIRRVVAAVSVAAKRSPRPPVKRRR